MRRCKMTRNATNLCKLKLIDYKWHLCICGVIFSAAARSGNAAGSAGANHLPKFMSGDVLAGPE